MRPASKTRFPPAATFTFGRGGNAKAHQTYGWSDPEDGYTFGVNGRSALVFPSSGTNNGLILELTVHPFLFRDILPLQRIAIRINGSIIGYASIARQMSIAYLIPPPLILDRNELVVEQPDATRPSDIGSSKDDRCLGIAFQGIQLYKLENPLVRSEYYSECIQVDRNRSFDEAISDVAEMVGMQVDRLVVEFEGLGDNCEFGLFQRRCGAEPLGLLRFSAITPEHLHKGLLTGFIGLGDPDAILPRLEDKPLEWMVHERRYGLRYHSFRREHEATESEIRSREIKKLPFLRRKLLEDLEECSKIFVFKRETSLSVEEVMPLFVALNQYGPNRLLFVVPATRTYKPGTCEEILPGLYRGHIDRLAHSSSPGLQSSIGWLEVCAAAHMLRRRGDTQP